MIMSIEEMSFPVIVIAYDSLGYHTEPDDSTVCSDLAFKKGIYNNLEFVDSNGNQYRVTKTTKLHGVGKFWGYNIFLGRRIRVALEIEFIRALTVKEIKDHIYKNNRGDLDAETRLELMKSYSIKDIMCAMYHWSRIGMREE